METSFPRKIQLAPSWGLIASVLFLHFAAGLALFISAPDYSAASICGIAAVAVSACLAVRSELAKAGIELVLLGDGRLRVGHGEDACLFRVRPGAVDFGFVLWLGFAEGEGRAAPKPYRLGVVPGNLKQDEWRTLRVWLRLLAFKREAESA
jgi:hypothetical protein